MANKFGFIAIIGKSAQGAHAHCHRHDRQTTHQSPTKGKQGANVVPGAHRTGPGEGGQYRGRATRAKRIWSPYAGGQRAPPFLSIALRASPPGRGPSCSEMSVLRQNIDDGVFFGWTCADNPIKLRPILQCWHRPHEGGAGCRVVFWLYPLHDSAPFFLERAVFSGSFRVFQGSRTRRVAV